MAQNTGGNGRKTRRRIWQITLLALASVALPAAVATYAASRLAPLASLASLASEGSGPLALTAAERPKLAAPPTRIGVNLSGLEAFGRQQVFANMILQSQWLVTTGDGWVSPAPGQMDADGWLRFLKPGEIAPRFLVLPPAPFQPMTVRCTFAGHGVIDVGGVATLRERTAQGLVLDLNPTGATDEVAWIVLMETDPQDPVRDIDCRSADAPASQRFSPEFVEFTRQFRIIRFLDWQKTNENAAVRWDTRTTTRSGSQVGPMGAAIEDMVDLANVTGADPWLLMPYKADDAYIRQFAKLVHDRLDPQRTAYVELGNEVWNAMFDASEQAQKEGISMGLGGGEPNRAMMERYAQKVRAAMKIWTEVFADRPDRLVRIGSTQNGWVDLGPMMMDYADTAKWIDAVATAPYFGFDLADYSERDLDRIFARMPAAIDEGLGNAVRHRALAEKHGKRYIAYEGGQHFVTSNLPLARAMQRDPRMGAAYARYLSQWQSQLGDSLVLFSATGPIAEYGAWGMREYAGQPEAETPKLQAIQQFIAKGH